MKKEYINERQLKNVVRKIVLEEIQRENIDEGLIDKILGGLRGGYNSNAYQSENLGNYGGQQILKVIDQFGTLAQTLYNMGFFRSSPVYKALELISQEMTAYRQKMGVATQQTPGSNQQQGVQQGVQQSQTPGSNQQQGVQQGVQQPQQVNNNPDIGEDGVNNRLTWDYDDNGYTTTTSHASQPFYNYSNIAQTPPNPPSGQQGVANANNTNNGNTQQPYKGKAEEYDDMLHSESIIRKRINKLVREAIKDTIR